jgi:hypothetical protein
MLITVNSDFYIISENLRFKCDLLSKYDSSFIKYLLWLSCLLSTTLITLRIICPILVPMLNLRKISTPFYIVSDSPAPHSKWMLLLKIESYQFLLYYNVHIKINWNFNCSYMAISSLIFVMIILSPVNHLNYFKDYMSYFGSYVKPM